MTLSTAKNAKAWRIELKKSLAPEGTQKLEVEILLAKDVEMFPKEIEQRERQLVSN